MKFILTESQMKFILEQYDDENDYYSIVDEITMDVFNKIKNQEKIKIVRINPQQYKSALTDFVKNNGMFNRFPVKYIYKWKNIMINGTAFLDVLTSINGHSQYFPYDEFYDVFDYSDTYTSNQYNLFSNELEDVTPDGEFTSWCKKKYEETGEKDYLKRNDFFTIMEFLEEVYHMDDFIPFFENGQPLLSDYGLKPLQELVFQLIDEEIPEEIIITINKMLDVSHQRSDLAELFIVGGSKSLDYIAEFEKYSELT